MHRQMRTAFVSVNLFSLLCVGGGEIPPSQYAAITRYGGPILYLIVYIFLLFFILVRVDSGSILPRNMSTARRQRELRASSGLATSEGPTEEDLYTDVLTEAKTVEESADPLRVVHVSKTFGIGRGANKVVDDVSLGVGEDMIFALLGQSSCLFTFEQPSDIALTPRSERR